MKSAITQKRIKIRNDEKKKHKGKIFLGRVYLRQINEKIRLCAEFIMDNMRQELYFEFDMQWKDYLVTEYSDPFILAIIEKAMKHAYDIEFETPMSEDLYYRLTTYLIPVYARNIKMFHEIELIGEITQKQIQTLGKVGTGFSAGVDSFYTVLKHLDNKKIPSYNVTHLLLALNGAASSGICEEQDEEWLENSRRKLEPFAEELGLPLICIGGNLDLIYAGDITLNGDTVTTAAFVHALRKLFGTYYWASAYPAEVFGFPDMSDGGFWENISVSYVSVPGLCFYHSGSETNRIGKVTFISDNIVAQESLTVCGNTDAINCGGCVKCLRTMAELYAVGKLNLFNKVFPVEKYKKHYVKKLAKELAIDHYPFTTDILSEMKRNCMHIPIRSYLLAYGFYAPLEIIRKKLRYKKWARKIYYALNLDDKLDDRKQSAKERERKLNGFI